MATKFENCPLRRKEFFLDLNAEEVWFMQKFKVGELVVDAGAPILMKGSSRPQLFTALRGMGRYCKTLKNGNRQLATWANGELRINDLDALAKMGMTDTTPPALRSIL